MTVAVTHARARGRDRRRLRVDRQHLGLDGRLRGAGGPAGARVRARGQGGGRQAGAGARLRRAHAARARRLRRLPAPGPRGVREALGITLLNSVNPWRIEGQKTIVLELLQQLGWDPPDWIVVPAGNLGNTAAFGKALREAKERGLIARVPRIAAVQAAGAAPFYRSFRGGFRRATACRRRRWRPRSASAIRPATTARVRAIRETRGVVAAVTDAEILEAKAVVDAAGHRLRAGLGRVGGGRAPAPARAGVIRRGRRVVADPHRPRAEGRGDGDALPRARRAARANPPIEIEPRVAAVERVLRKRAAQPKRCAPASPACVRGSRGSSTENVLPRPRLGLGPDAAAVPLHDEPADVEAQARCRRCARAARCARARTSGRAGSSGRAGCRGRGRPPRSARGRRRAGARGPARSRRPAST